MWADGRSDGRCNSSGSTTGGCVCGGSAGCSQSSNAKAGIRQSFRKIQNRF